MSIESDRYKITKNNDILLLTDKKTLKARKLEPEDVDYVIDDNQKIRDSSIIENYFRLKDEPYEAKMQTKTADYVKEQKEADKYGVRGYTDIIEQFIKKNKLTEEEISQLGAIPDETSIRKFKTRNDSDKKAIINDFKNLKKELTEDKKITDIFTYLKAYFKNYVKETTKPKFTDVVNYLKVEEKYSKEDWEKIENTEPKNLEDIKYLTIKTFDGIDLDLLSNWCQRISELYNTINPVSNKVLQYYPNGESYNKNFKNKLILAPNPLDLIIWVGKSNDIPDTPALLLIIKNTILDNFIKYWKSKRDKDIMEELKKISVFGLKYFNNSFKINIVKKSFEKDYFDTYNFIGDCYRDTPLTYLTRATKITKSTETGGENNFIKSKLFEVRNAALLITDKNVNQLVKTLDNIGKILIKPIDNVAGNLNQNLSGGWTDKTLTRIDKINDVLKNVSNGFGGGWTDKTLTRIDKINDVLNNVSAGKMNSYLMKIASRYSNGFGGGWTDKTLTRIDKINDILRQY